MDILARAHTALLRRSAVRSARSSQSVRFNRLLRSRMEWVEWSKALALCFLGFLMVATAFLASGEKLSKLLAGLAVMAFVPFMLVSFVFLFESFESLLTRRRLLRDQRCFLNQLSDAMPEGLFACAPEREETQEEGHDLITYRGETSRGTLLVVHQLDEELLLQLGGQVSILKSPLSLGFTPAALTASGVTDELLLEEAVWLCKALNSAMPRNSLL